MEIAKHLLFNLSILLVVLFFFQIESDRNITDKRKKILFFGYICSSIVLCMMFTFFLNPHIRVDLRFVPLVIGSLYYGSGFLFAGFTILVRALYETDSGFWITAFVSTLLAFLLYAVKPFFQKSSKSKRIFLSVILSIVSSAIFIQTISVLDHRIYQLEVWLSYIVVSAIGTGITAYAVESINYNAQLREQMVKAKRLDAISKMGAAMSHEIRNPLTSARGFLQFIKEDETLNPSHSTYIDIVLRELDQAEEVISSYITFAKPVIENIDEIEIKQLLTQVLTGLRPSLESNQISLEEKYSSAGILHGDDQMLQRCFHNLIKECIESMPSGGTLKLAVKESKRDIKVTISDNGCGMSEEQVNRVGEPYYITDTEKGTGLGMMVVSSIIRAMNGNLEINSELNKGTTYVVTLPK